MSHFTRVKTEIRDPWALIRALKTLGYAVANVEADTVGSGRSTVPVQVLAVKGDLRIRFAKSDSSTPPTRWAPIGEGISKGLSVRSCRPMRRRRSSQWQGRRATWSFGTGPSPMAGLKSFSERPHRRTIMSGQIKITIDKRRKHDARSGGCQRRSMPLPHRVS